MKEQVLHLDPHDDYVSARDKMGWAQTTRVLVVWPAAGKVLRRKIDLLLLQRHARRLGAHLALVTDDPVVRENARETGLPVFGSVEASQHSTWTNRTGRTAPKRTNAALDRGALRKPARLEDPPLPAWLTWASRILVFIVGVGGLTALAAAIAPAAQVVVTPASSPVLTSVQIVADPHAVGASGATIPARIVRVEVEATGQTNTTGRSEVPTQPAGGTVVFTNLDGVATTIPAGTGLRTTSGSPVRFRTLNSVPIEGRIGAVVSVGVQAVDLGPVGNVAAGQINAIDGPLGLQFAVTNLTPAAGGARAQRASVTADDQTRLYDELLAQLQTDAANAVQSQLVPGEFTITSSVEMADVVARTFNLAVGEQNETVQLTLRLAFTGLAVNENQARAVAEAALVEEVPFRQTLLAGSERYTRVPESTVYQDGRIHFNVEAAGLRVPVIDPELVRMLVKGQTVPQAQIRLATALHLSGLPQITVQPDWYPRVPWMPFRIDVVVAAGG